MGPTWVVHMGQKSHRYGSPKGDLYKTLTHVQVSWVCGGARLLFWHTVLYYMPRQYGNWVSISDLKNLKHYHPVPTAIQFWHDLDKRALEPLAWAGSWHHFVTLFRFSSHLCHLLVQGFIVSLFSFSLGPHFGHHTCYLYYTLRQDGLVSGVSVFEPSLQCTCMFSVQDMFTFSFI